jgi:hypothetical protein
MACCSGTDLVQIQIKGEGTTVNEKACTYYVTRVTPLGKKKDLGIVLKSAAAVVGHALGREREPWIVELGFGQWKPIWRVQGSYGIKS